jgi:hypothetical protein
MSLGQDAKAELPPTSVRAKGPDAQSIVSHERLAERAAVAAIDPGEIPGVPAVGADVQLGLRTEPRHKRQDAPRSERCPEGIPSPATQDSGPIDLARAVDVLATLLPLLRRLNARREEGTED